MFGKYEIIQLMGVLLFSTGKTAIHCFWCPLALIVRTCTWGGVNSHFYQWPMGELGRSICPELTVCLISMVKRILHWNRNTQMITLFTQLLENHTQLTVQKEMQMKQWASENKMAQKTCDVFFRGFSLANSRKICKLSLTLINCEHTRTTGIGRTTF